MAAFALAEAAKRRLVFQLDELALPTAGVELRSAVQHRAAGDHGHAEV
jgi:hypothetical protein